MSSFEGPNRESIQDMRQDKRGPTPVDRLARNRKAVEERDRVVSCHEGDHLVHNPRPRNKGDRPMMKRDQNKVNLPVRDKAPRNQGNLPVRSKVQREQGDRQVRNHNAADASYYLASCDERDQPAHSLHRRNKLDRLVRDKVPRNQGNLPVRSKVQREQGNRQVRNHNAADASCYLASCDERDQPAHSLHHRNKLDRLVKDKDPRNQGNLPVRSKVQMEQGNRQVRSNNAADASCYLASCDERDQPAHSLHRRNKLDRPVRDKDPRNQGNLPVRSKVQREQGNRQVRSNNAADASYYLASCDERDQPAHSLHRRNKLDRLVRDKVPRNQGNLPVRSKDQRDQGNQARNKNMGDENCYLASCHGRDHPVNGKHRNHKRNRLTMKKEPWSQGDLPVRNKDLKNQENNPVRSKDQRDQGNHQVRSNNAADESCYLASCLVGNHPVNGKQGDQLAESQHPWNQRDILLRKKDRRKQESQLAPSKHQKGNRREVHVEGDRLDFCRNHCGEGHQAHNAHQAQIVPDPLLPAHRRQESCGNASVHSIMIWTCKEPHHTLLSVRLWVYCNWSSKAAAVNSWSSDKEIQFYFMHPFLLRRGGGTEFTCVRGYARHTTR
ncbi:unnamed protein product [Haemonchus placei]|uniref:Telomerase-binding protein EST1A n=1 Tax=Haemonchus placei TaxID=6290 RepID=A0A0N4X1R7_HAEPC|nr:unnamed protein product [Haemonchus placei]